jgi:peptide/nickel transport system permease protein
LLGFVVRRIAVSLVVLLLASFVSFTATAASGDPLAELRNKQPPPPPETIERIVEDLRLDQPVVARWGLWLGDFVQGDMGDTIQQRSVSEQIGDRLPTTLRMVLVATVLAAIAAIVVGCYSAIRQYSIGDYVSTGVGFLFLSTPIFVIGLLLKEFLGIRINGWIGRADDPLIFTSRSESDPLFLPDDFWGRMLDYAGHLVLPTLALATASFAAWSRYQRASMLDVLSSDYVRLARAKGISPRRVLTRHMLRNALIPLTTVIAIDFAAVFGGAVITETVFNWNGMGKLLINAIQTIDPNMVTAWLMVTGVLIVVFNLLADILYGILDPRIRVG